MTSPLLEKVKHNILEFGRAGKGVKLIRAAFADQIELAKDRRLTPRMQTLVMKLVKSDNIKGRGERLLENGDFRLLNNFEMNGNAELQRSMPVKIISSYDRPSGKVVIDIPSFVPAQTLKHTANATDYRIVCAAAEFDFKNGEFIASETATPFEPIDTVNTASIVLTTTLSPDSVFPVLITVGIQFAEFVNGIKYPERSGEFNALCIVKADKP